MIIHATHFNPSKRLFDYSTTAALILASGSLAAQGVVYTDLDPDIQVSFSSPAGSDIEFVDFDGDSLNDLAIRVERAGSCSSPYTTTSGYFFCNCYEYQSGVFGVPGGAEFFASASNLISFNPGEPIGTAGPWYVGGRIKFRSATHDFVALTSYDTCSVLIDGSWQLGNNRYAGFRLSKLAGYYYGWVEIEMVDFDHYIIKSYAYNSTPDAPIVAGELCPTPENLTTSLTTVGGGTNVSLSWDPEPLADGYKILGRVSGTSSFVKISEPGTLRVFTGLPPNDYEWTVLSVCGSQKSEVAPSESFTVTTVAARAKAVRRETREHERTE